MLAWTSSSAHIRRPLVTTLAGVPLLCDGDAKGSTYLSIYLLSSSKESPKKSHTAICAY